MKNGMVNKVYFFDSHPVQYKAPVYRELEKMLPGAFEIIYASDFSVRGGRVDKNFGREIVWDTPLLAGYGYRVLNNETNVPMPSVRSLSGRGIFSLLRRERPRAIVLTHSRYIFDHVAYASALLLGIPILIRQETQDDTFSKKRPKIKSILRSLVYRAMYAPVRHAFAFGKLNYSHLIRHGVDSSRISFAHFSVPDPVKSMSLEQRSSCRRETRSKLNIRDDQVVVGFFGKFIAVKNPRLIYEALSHISDDVRTRLHLVFVGSGHMQDELALLAMQATKQWGIETTFTGFVNQTELAPYYLTTDVMVLPSVSEAWGLVINEALHAGCAVVMTDTVGCRTEFGHFDRVRVVPAGSAPKVAEAIESLAALPRDLTWAEAPMQEYSTEAAAQALKNVLVKYIE